MRRWVSYATAVAALLLPFVVRAATFDVTIRRADVTFVPERFFVGDTVRVYATLQNMGDRDAFGNAFFSENGTAIGTAPPFSVKARGAPEDVWVDWQPATFGDRQLFIKFVTAPETRDEDLTNNEMIVPVFVDVDTDHDGIGDREDADDDGDGLPDTWEEAHGLNPKDPSDANRDPDGDGVSTIEEYRRGTDPFTKEAVDNQRQTSGGGGAPSTTPTTVVTAPVPSPSTVTVTPATSGAPKQPSTSPMNAPGASPRKPASRPPTVTTETIVLTADRSGQNDAEAIATAPVDAQLESLLGSGGLGGIRLLPIAALLVAFGAIVGVVVLVRRRARE